MNWRRGLLRLWLALSLCWIAGVGVFAWEHNAWMKSRTAACFEAKRAQGVNPWDCFDRDEQVRLSIEPVGLADIAAAAKEYTVVALLPPLVTLVLGLLGAWVISGFARKREGAEGKS
jgi:hypothetical protein